MENIKELQTLLECLEQAYLNNLNILHEVENAYLIEEVTCSISEITKSIMLLVNLGSVYPVDKRVYIDITENNNTFSLSDEETKKLFMETLYEHDILTPEITVGELIEELKRFAPSIKVNVLGKNNTFNKVVIDDCYLDKILIVGAEH